MNLLSKGAGLGLSLLSPVDRSWMENWPLAGKKYPFVFSYVQ